MRVSKRLPNVFPGREQSGFVEYRYFRCGAESVAMAVWFGLLEVYTALPVDYRERLLQRVNNCPDAGKKTMVHWMMQGDQYLSPNDKLSVWNCEEGLNYQKEIFAEMAGCSAPAMDDGRLAAFCDDVRIVLIDFNPTMVQKVPAYGGRLELLVCLERAGEAMLFYRHFGRDSFYVSRCGHVNLKRTLFGKVGERMQQRAESLVDFSQMVVQCTCGGNIAWEVAELMRNEADAVSEQKGKHLFMVCMSNTAFPNISQSRCEFCNVPGPSAGVKRCQKSCKVCDNCLLINYCSISYPWCPVCTERLSSETITDLSQCVASLRVAALLPPRRSISQGEMCAHARQGTVGTHLFEEIGHCCQLCDECWTSFVVAGNLQTCPVCNVHFCDRDQRKLSRAISNSEVRIRLCACSVKLSTATQCRHLKTPSSVVWLYNNKALCTECIVRKAPAQCPSCSTVPKLRCANCTKSLGLQDGQGLSRLESCCAKGCVLCFCCIYLENNKWRCGRCKAECLKTRKNPKDRRRELTYRCCCQLHKYSTLEIANCGHIRHKDCPPVCSCEVAIPPS